MESLSRPEPQETLARRVVAWIGWFGVGRLVAASIATVIVCGGAFWLVRSPPPPIEASLPIATTTTQSPEPSTVTPTSASSAVLVHVAGSVAVPGVYELPAGARVRDAIVAAGGPADDADWNALNLAAPVVDGTRVYVPAVGENVPDVAEVGPGSSPPGPIDVNRATAAELEELPGVGPATASAIVTERERNGPFSTVDELERVPGIGPAKLDALRGLVTT